MYRNYQDVNQNIEEMASMVQYNGWQMTIEILRQIAEGSYEDEELTSALEDALVAAQDGDERP